MDYGAGPIGFFAANGFFVRSWSTHAAIPGAAKHEYRFTLKKGADRDRRISVR